MSESIGERVDSKALDRGLIRGVAWVGASKAATQLFSWATLLVVARLLAPSDYGVAAASATAIGLVGMVTELGLGTAVVAMRDLSSRELSQLAGVGVVGGIAAWIVSALLALVLPTALRVPELRYILPVSGVVVALAAAATVPMASLRRGMDFRGVARIDLARAVVASGAMLTLAFTMRSYWAIILSEVAASVVMLVLVMSSFRQRVHLPVWRDVRASLAFSRDVLVSRIAWYVYDNADFAVVGRMLGKQSLGDYSMAWTLVTLPNEKIATLVLGVTPSVFAKVRDDLPEFRRYVLLLVEVLSTLLFPACIGMALVAPELVLVALGPSWSASVPIVQALAAFAMVRAISPIASQVLVSRGRTREALGFSLLGAVLLPVGFWVGTRWGTVGVALVWPIVFPVIGTLQFRAAARELEMPLSAAGRVLLPSVIGTLGMGVAVAAARSAMVGAHLPPVVILAASVAIGALVYALAMVLLARPRLQMLWRLVRYRQF